MRTYALYIVNYYAISKLTISYFQIKYIILHPKNKTFHLAPKKVLLLQCQYTIEELFGAI